MEFQNKKKISTVDLVWPLLELSKSWIALACKAPHAFILLSLYLSIIGKQISSCSFCQSGCSSSLSISTPPECIFVAALGWELDLLDQGFLYVATHTCVVWSFSIVWAKSLGKSDFLTQIGVVLGGEKFFRHCLVLGRICSFLQWGRMCPFFPQWWHVDVRAACDTFFFFVLLSTLFESGICGVAYATLEIKIDLLLAFKVDVP